MAGFAVGLAFGLEECFDLDLALTVSPVEEEGEYLATTPSPHEVSSMLVSDMPTVSGVGMCSICIEKFKNSGNVAKQMPCGHLYHSTCISSWLSRYNTCPLCRSIVHLPASSGPRISIQGGQGYRDFGGGSSRENFYWND
ncbi:hypothetical protein GIB67_043172 [Kingdonia uniflora]|uniref:RING-type domain-containing protein n=1 Tax=Kingdonia uniflora TaxID=39325 RepID=A0A7J7NJ84_9MAGN|nr:hypothetical protein GIB67_043172 [Kingdonia uniflora]